MTFDASDPRQIKAAEKAAKAAARRRAETIANLCMTQQGREYLWQELASCMVFQSIFDDNHSRMCFNEGMRNRGLALLAQIIEFAPDAFPQMMREQNGREHSTSQRSSGANGHGRDQGPVDDGGIDQSDVDPDGSDEDPAFYDR